MADARDAELFFLETTMTLALPRDIEKKFERRWSARFSQAESVQAGTDHLKQETDVVAESTLDDQSQPTRQEPASQN
jgi:hypothetical protein